VISRRAFGAGICGLAAIGATDAGAPSALDVRVITLAGRRVLVAVPAASDAASPARLRVAVLLHGLGETGDAELGARAWAERYGLLSCDARLRAPPIAATSTRGDLPSADILRMNTELARAPYRGLTFVCPHMPNAQTKAEALAYGAWLRASLVPALSSALPRERSSRMALGGCSLGGFAALEIAASGDTTFDVIACVQSAISAPNALRLAERIHQKMYLATSSLDPYRLANEALAGEAARLGRDVLLHQFPGPHDQPWLREAGTLDLLLWLDRAL
jgi:hypothetical protein